MSTLVKQQKEKTKPLRKVMHTWVTTNKVVCLVLAKELARKHGLTEPSDVILEDRAEGILIRKLNLDDRG